jgi:selenocysteine-specific elongation factor
VKELPVVNVVLGTAGHIDHGKTALIKRLTGIDADRLKEEQSRGMTIDIGYAHMVVDRKLQLGVIDVPGHERFIKNMVAGATGVGLVILVVAADDGVMPQTREHLEIMEILGVELGAVALTKIDLVDEELVELAEEDVRDFVRGTFLENAPLVRVSSVTGEGFDALQAVLSELVQKAEGPSDAGPLYLPVQRAFASEGHGTVITGVPVRGRVSVGDVLELAPAGRSVRVRGIEAYGNQLEEARAGHRTALNLAEVGHREIQRGDVLGTPGYFRAWSKVVARLRMLGSRKTPLKHQASIRFHVGTAETTGRAFLLEGKKLSPGETGFVQLRLDAPLVAAPGDRFIIRTISPMTTLGGGLVIRGTERRLKSGRDWVMEEVRRWEKLTAGPKEAVCEVLREAGTDPLTLKDIARRAGLRPEEAKATADALGEKEAIRAVGTGDRFLLGEAFEALLKRMEEELASFHRDHPLAEGLDRVALRTAVGVGKAVFETAFRALTETGRVALHQGLARAEGFSVSLSEEEGKLLTELEEAYRKAGVKPPAPEEAFQALGDDRTPTLYRLLVQRGTLVEISRDGLTFHRDVLADVKKQVVDLIREKGELVAAEFRDRLGTTRKYIIPLLEHFDKIGLTIRVENQRFLREHVRGPEKTSDS